MKFVRKFLVFLMYYEDLKQRALCQLVPWHLSPVHLVVTEGGTKGKEEMI